MTMADAIEIHDLTKTFGRTRALDGLDLTVATGEVRGFLGPNGAGKSTTIRILLGFLRPDAGTARVLGGDAWRDAPRLHRRLACVPGDVSLWPNLSGGEAIDLLARARGSLDVRRRDELVERFELDVRTKGRSYSKGNRQKVALVSALASGVELLLLDEPTSGLDPLMERTFREVIAEEKARGRTVLLSSHILSEVEALCDTVSIIKDGRIVESGPLERLRHLQRLHVTAVLGRRPEGLDALPGVHGVEIDGDRLTLQVEAEAMAPVLELLARSDVRSLTSTPPTLEEIFVRYYDGRGTAPGDGPARQTPQAPQAEPARRHGRHAARGGEAR